MRDMKVSSDLFGIFKAFMGDECCEFLIELFFRIAISSTRPLATIGLLAGKTQRRK